MQMEKQKKMVARLHTAHAIIGLVKEKYAESEQAFSNKNKDCPEQGTITEIL